MVQIDATYDGGLRCRATHAESGATLSTDAPKDNQGQGLSFSPTDLLATALGTCMLTTMGIAANRLGVDLTGAHVRVRKEMTAEAPRRVSKLTVEITGPSSVPNEHRLPLERAAIECPVSRSLSPAIQTGIVFQWAK